MKAASIKVEAVFFLFRINVSLKRNIEIAIVNADNKRNRPRE